MLIVDEARLVLSDVTLGGRDDDGASGEGEGGSMLMGAEATLAALGEGVRSVGSRLGDGVRGEVGIVAGGAGQGAVRIEIGRGALTEVNLFSDGLLFRDELLLKEGLVFRDGDLRGEIGRAHV